MVDCLFLFCRGIIVVIKADDKEEQAQMKYNHMRKGVDIDED